MAGRHFDGRTVEAYVADGTEKFKKTNEKKKGMFDYDDDEGDEEEKRLDEFGTWLEQEQGGAEAT